jgi:phosphoribosylanthranilate isomerase
LVEKLSVTWVKLCGITSLEDALTAVESGANALGFVFYSKSRRKVDAATVKQIVAELPKSVEKIGVFVEESPAAMEQVAGEAGLTGIQLHLTSMRASPQLTSRVNYLAIPATLAEQAAQLQKDIAIKAIFIDSGTPSDPGGTGKVFDWEKAGAILAALRERFKIVVAGGLTPSNVGDAIRILRPWGVDVSSGVESSPGKKDPAKIQAFIQAVRQTETSR